MKLTCRRAKLLFAVAAALLGAPAAAAQPSAQAARAWGFDRSDLQPHPAVRFGVLANGLRYAVMRSEVPARGLAVRLRFEAGANVESERERGFMHLIEHLIFHGTPNIPEGALPLMLSSRGLQRWSDFNAATSHDETVYQLDLGRADAAARDTALALMREIASNLQFTKPVVEGAKKKVVEEIAARDALADRIAAAENAFFMPGTPIARGPVAGSAASVRRATGEALRRLYAEHYVPARATLVMVGDFDPALAEAEIAARFSQWEGKGGAEAALPAVRGDRGTEAHLFVDPRAPTTVTIAAVEPLVQAVDAAGPRDQHFLAQLGADMLNRRLAAIAAGADAPFASANLAIYDHFSTARLARIEIAARGGDWRRALQAGAAELRRALAGFTQAELDAQLAFSRSAFGRAAPPPTSSALADAIVDAVGRRIVFTAPGDPAASAAYLDRIRLADVNAAFKNVWAKPGRLLFVSHDRRIPGGDTAIAAAWAGPKAGAGGLSRNGKEGEGR